MYAIVGNLLDFELGSNVRVIDYDGLQAQREFYAPVYDMPSASASRIPDFRSLLYWKPDVITKGDGASQLSFTLLTEKGSL